jgi:uncharacterized membrane protein
MPSGAEETMNWTEQNLRELSQSKGFRLRGEQMTRLETFADAAFAFATTMLVISVGTIPDSYQDLIQALKGTPAFAASFAFIVLVWAGHRKWSRRYGLEDTSSTLISLGLIFIMLVYVYPLKLMFSALFAWMTGGLLPAEFTVNTANELLGLFAVYGFGSAALAAALALLYARARSAADSLKLNALERVRTKEDIIVWSVIACTGLTSACFALLMPPRIGVYAGFIYFSLPVAMTVLSVVYDRKAGREA